MSLYYFNRGVCKCVFHYGSLYKQTKGNLPHASLDYPTTHIAPTLALDLPKSKNNVVLLNVTYLKP